MRTNSFIAVPANVDNPDVLKRFLNSLILHLDTAFGNRGSGGFATSADYNSTATTVDGVVKDLNNMSKNYLRADGTIPAVDALSYDKALKFTKQLEIVNKDYVDTLYKPQQAPSKINSSSSDSDIKANADKIDEIIDLLKNAKIFT